MVQRQPAEVADGLRPVVGGVGHDVRVVSGGRLPPAQAALVAADVADQLAARQAQGLPLTLEAVAVDRRGPRPRAVLHASARPEGAPPADVHAIGLLLAELLGADPAGGSNMPESLWAVVRACLATEPDSRPAAAHVAARLRRCARDLLLGREEAPHRPDRHGVPAPDYMPGPPPVVAPARRKRRGRVLVVVTTTAAVILAAVGVALAVTQPAPPRRAAAPATRTSTTTTAPTTTPPPATGTTPPEAPPTQETPRTETVTQQPPPQPQPTGEPTKEPTKEPSPGSGSPQQPTSVCTPSGCAARASFAAYGDHLYVCDNKADDRCEDMLQVGLGLSSASTHAVSVGERGLGGRGVLAGKSPRSVRFHGWWCIGCGPGRALSLAEWRHDQRGG